MSVFEDLVWRGLVHDASADVADALDSRSVTVYSGFDPSADSLHVGSLLPLMTLARLQRAGHRPIGLVGGGTGLIGDPSGKTRERQLLTRDQVEDNVRGIRAQIERFLDFEDGKHAALLIDNADWLAKLGLITFLRDTGKHFTVNGMLAKESVRRRIESEDGISFTEFSYMLLQAYDFLALNESHGCEVQIGGSDQWGNITAGIDLIRRVRGARAHGFTFPLLTTAAGTKFGKTEAGTIWLDARRTSPFKFHQFFLNTDDRDVVRHLKSFTFLEHDEIRDLERCVEEAPEKREAQRVLADILTRLLHGEKARQRAGQASKLLFSEAVSTLDADLVLDFFDDVPSVTVPASELRANGLPVFDLLARTELCRSRGEARRLVSAGGVSLNNRRLQDPEGMLTLQDAIDGRLFLFRKGKKSWFLVKVQD